MEPPYAFQYLDIHSCWPASDADLYRYAHQVRPQGGEPGRLVASMLTDLESILHVCLLTMEPFQGGTDTQLCDTRRTPRVYDCPARPRLVEAIAEALCFYEWMQCQRARTLQQRPLALQHALNEVARGLEIAAHLKQQRPGRPAFRQIQTFLDIVTQLETQTADDHHAYAQPPHHLTAKMHHRAYYELVRHMYAAFTTHIPSQSRYPLGAVWHTIAVILTRVGLEQDTPEAIAKRLPVELKRTEKRYAAHMQGEPDDINYVALLRVRVARRKQPRRAR